MYMKFPMAPDSTSGSSRAITSGTMFGSTHYGIEADLMARLGV